MINTNNVGGEGYKDSNQLPEDGLINKTLPLEIFTRVLSYLDGMDVKQASLVSHLWSEVAIDSAKREEFALIKKYVEQIAESLKKVAKSLKEAPKDLLLATVDLLLATVNSNKTLGSVNLMEVKASIDSLKVNMADILKGVSIEDLENLEDIPKPPLFENILVQAKFHRLADELIQKSPPDERACLEMIDSLVNLSLFEKALKFALAIPHQEKSIQHLFYHIPFEQAENLIPLLPDTLKDTAYEGMSHGLMFKNELEKAENVALLIQDENSRTNMLRAIIASMIAIGRFDRIPDVLSLVEKIQSAPDRDAFCYAMSVNIAKGGHVEKAKEFVNLIVDPDMKSDALWDVNHA